MLKLSLKQKRWVMRLMAVFLAIFCGLVYHAGCSKAQDEPLSELETIVLTESDTVLQQPSSYAPGITDESQAFISQDGSGNSPQETVCQEIYVYVCGCVKRPGVYALSPGARIYEAIQAAEGMTEEADQSYVNLALVVTDQMQIYIPSQTETESGDFIRGSMTGESQDSQREKVNINTASASQFDELPGIGPSKAADIINYREEHGSFSSIDQLMDIPGIKTGVFDQIKDLVTVD